jgi:hypothetical protein
VIGDEGALKEGEGGGEREREVSTFLLDDAMTCAFTGSLKWRTLVARKCPTGVLPMTLFLRE